MRLAKSGPDARAANPQARAGESPQPQSYAHHQHDALATSVTTAPAGAALHQQNQIVGDGNSGPTNTSYDRHRPPSSNNMTSESDAADAVDFGVKFIGGLDEMPATTTRVQPTAQPTAATSDPPQHHGQQILNPTTAVQPKPIVGPSDYYTEKPRQREEAARQENNDEADCHPFWLSWRDIFLGIWLVVTGLLQIPLVIGDGMGKALHHTPELYGDKTVRKWPRITGFLDGCVAGCIGLWYGLYDGLTDWITFTYKAVRDGERFQGCLKAFLQGFANIIVKPIAG
ncbi:UDP-Glycosyltransferase/glycogen phosphorylase [Apiospora saccharicola]